MNEKNATFGTVKKIKVLIAEDHSIVRSGIRLLLDNDPDLSVVAAVSNGEEALGVVKEHADVDVLLTDIQMPGMDGISLIDQLKEIRPELNIVLLSMHKDIHYLKEAFQRGAAGYLVKECEPEELLFAIRRVASGANYISVDLAQQILDLFVAAKTNPNEATPSNVDFTTRELEVLQLISEGLTNNEISEQIFLSRRTVEGHRQSLLEKTACRNTAMLIKYAVRHQLIT